MQEKRRQIRFAIFSLLAVFSATILKAQNTEQQGISYKAIGGYAWAHSGKVSNLSAHIYGFKVGYRVKTANRRQWHRAFKKPIWGLDYMYLNYGKPNILGASHSFLSYINFPFIKYKKINTYIKLTSGLGYITRPFNLNTNISNWTIGSNLNINLGLEGELVYPISKKTELLLGAGLTHFSNGNFSKPNLGINTPVVSVGLTHYINDKKITTPEPDNLDTSKNNYSFSLAFGHKNADYIFPKRITVPIFQFKYLRSLTPKNKLGGGIDYFYDREFFYKNNRDKNISEATISDASELGIKISHELQWHIFSLITDLGYYIFNKNDIKGNFYQRIGVNFNFTENISAYSALKFHIRSADYFEVGLNYHIRKN